MKDLANIYLNTLVPMVVEQTNRGERAYDIYSRLLKERIVGVNRRDTPMAKNFVERCRLGSANGESRNASFDLPFDEDERGSPNSCRASGSGFQRRTNG